MYKGVTLFFVLFVALYFVHHIRVVVLVLLLTLLFSIIVSGPVDWLGRRGLGRPWGTLLVLGALTLVALAVRGLAPVVPVQARQLVDTFPVLRANAEGFARQTQVSWGSEPSFELRTGLLMERGRIFLSEEAFPTIASFGASVANGLSLVAVILISTIYTVARPQPLVRGFVAFFPAQKRQGVRKLLREMYGAVRSGF